MTDEAPSPRKWPIINDFNSGGDYSKTIKIAKKIGSLWMQFLMYGFR